MPRLNPFSKKVNTVLSLTAPPNGVAIEGRADAIAVGLLMRSRVFLQAMAVLADRMLAGATDPIARAILETAFAASWVLNTPNADLLYIGQHRKKWMTIAAEIQAKSKVLAKESGAPSGWIDLADHPELEPFLEIDETLPPLADLPHLEQMAKDGGFGEFYTVYRMITRRAHPNLDAARSRLSWNEQTGRFAPVAAPTAIELGDTYVELCIYVVAKLGMFVDERLGWGNADGLHAVLDGMTETARTALRNADTVDGDEPQDAPSSGS
jgi:hypothetical protein